MSDPFYNYHDIWAGSIPADSIPVVCQGLSVLYQYKQLFKLGD